MMTWDEVIVCEGYYREVETGAILRNVLPEPRLCSDDVSGRNAPPDGLPANSRFERIGGDVTLPLKTIIRLAQDQFGAPPGRLVRFINRQTAVQPDGSLITEEGIFGDE